ncbi:MAG: AAA family ATPase [Caldilineaceae bacterium]|nr:AAA family ATPase [Caldilineaceae bacterium]
MSGNQAMIQTLREAVAVSPDNAPLRQHLADMLLQGAHYAEAEHEYRAVLALLTSQAALRNLDKVQMGLVQALAGQGKVSEALAVFSPLLTTLTTIPAEFYLLHARLLVQTGERARAIGEYLRALDLEPALADQTLAAQLGLQPDNADPDFEAPVPPAGPPAPPPQPAAPATPPASPTAGRSVADDVESWMKMTADGDVVGGDVAGGDVAGGDEEKTADLPVTVERPQINFTQVGGMESVKEEINIKIIQPLLHPDLYRAYGKRAGGGILMYGPPGCGKTHLARATAGEVRAQFISVGIHDILDMYFGNSEQKLHQLFAMARRNQPCVLFFDEVDALGASRRDMRTSTGRHLINQFLAELDGANTSNEGILILAATNAPWHLDAAFRRPGRFDRILFVPPPDAPARTEILRILLQDKPTQAIEYSKLGEQFQELSGADLKAVIDSAVEAKLREVMKSGRPTPITTKDLQQAAKTIRSTTKEWFLTARNYALYANEGGLYDEILTYLGIKKS